MATMADREQHFSAVKRIRGSRNRAFPGANFGDGADDLKPQCLLDRVARPGVGAGGEAALAPVMSLRGRDSFLGRFRELASRR